MIAIAAQDRENVASVQTSTQVEMNKNIYNRLYPNVSNRESLDEKEDRDIVFSNIQNLLFFVKKYIVTGKKPVYEDVTLAALNMYLNQLITVADGGTNYKAIIPITLEVKMDGISGITIGEIFRINANILPTEYNDKNVGFIVTGIAHDITRADWITTLTTQFCLLDQQEKYQRSIAKADNFYKGLFEYVERVRPLSIISIKYFNILISFLSDFFSNRLTISNFDSNNCTIDYSEGIPELDKTTRNAIQSFDIDNKDYTLFFNEIGKITKNGWFAYKPNVGSQKNKYERPIGLKKEEPLFSRYLLEGDLSSLFSSARFSKENIQKYLDYVIFSNSYYDKMSKNNDKIKRVFDEIYKQLLLKYLGAPSSTSQVFTLLKAFASSFVDISEDFLENGFQSSGILGNPDLFIKLVEADGKTEYVISYLNPNCLDDRFAKVDPDKLFLKEKVIIKLTRLL
jgi:hypothetical protein